MMKYLYLLCAALAAITAPVQAQSGAFDRPTAGFVFSSATRSIRPLVGVAGSAYIGNTVLAGVDAAWVSPGGKWALVAKESRSALIRDLGTEIPAECPSAGLIPAVDRVAWSADGAFAAVYSSSAGLFQRVRLGCEVSADDPVDLTPWGAPTALAIDPSGGRIALGIATAGVYVIDGAGPPALVARMANPAALAFSDAGRLYAVDTETRQIVEFAADLSPSQFAVAETAGEAPFDPVGLAVSGSGNYLMLADRAARTVRVYDIAARLLSDTIQLNLAPTQMERLAAGSAFLLNRAQGREWLLVLDAADAPRVYFIPAPAEEVQ